MDGHWTDEDAAIVAQTRALEWRLGDRLRHAIAADPRAKATAARAMFRDAKELSLMARVCAAFPDTRRRYNLTFAHHAEVLKLPTDEQRDEMLTRAIMNGWSARQTGREVLAERIKTGDYQPLQDDDPEDREMRSIAQAWNRASRAGRDAFLPLAEDAGLGEIVL